MTPQIPEFFFSGLLDKSVMIDFSIAIEHSPVGSCARLDTIAARPGLVAWARWVPIVRVGRWPCELGADRARCRGRWASTVHAVEGAGRRPCMLSCTLAFARPTLSWAAGLSIMASSVATENPLS